MLDTTVQTPLDNLLAELRQIERKHRETGLRRSHEDMLEGGLACIGAMVKMLQALGEPIPSPLNHTIAAMVQHLDPHFPHTAHLFIPPANLAAKSEPAGWLTQVKKSMLTAVCQVLHEDGLTVAEACRCVAAEVDRAELHFEDGRARDRKRQGTRTVERLKEWRKDANAGKFKAPFPDLYECAKTELTSALAVIKRHKPASLVYLDLINNVVAKICTHTVRVGGNDPL